MCVGGHRSLSRVPFEPIDTTGFDFGDGYTALDEYVDLIRGSADAHQWSADQWAAAMECSLQTKDLGRSLCACAPVPAWLRPACNGHARTTTETCYPVLFATDTEQVDWFALSDTYGDACRFSRAADTPELHQVRTAVNLIQLAGAVARVSTLVTPGENPSTEIGFEFRSLTVTWPNQNQTSQAAIVTAVSTALGGLDPLLDDHPFRRWEADASGTPPERFHIWDWYPWNWAPR